MAIEAYVPLSASSTYRKRPIDSHGKWRSIYTKIVAAVQGDIGSTFALGTLPPGAVRLLYPSCFSASGAGGAGLVINIGYKPYRYKQDAAALNDGIEAGSVNALAAALSVAAAARTVWSATLIKYDFYSVAGVEVYATAAGAVVPLNFTMETLVTYLYE